MLCQRGALCLTVVGLLLALARGAQDEAGKRELQGEDAREAARLEKMIDDLRAEGKFAEAVKPAEKLLALRQQVQGEKHWQTVNARVRRDTLKQVASQPPASQQEIVSANKDMSEAGQLRQQGRYGDGEARIRQALAIRRKVLGKEHPDTATSLNDLAVSLYEQGKYARAEQPFREALAINRKALGEHHPETVTNLNNLASILGAQGKHGEGEALVREVLAIRRKVLGEEHPDTALSLNNLAVNLDEQGRSAEAEPLKRQALAIRRKALGDLHPYTASSFNNLAFTLKAQGKLAEAEVLYRQGLALFRKILGEEHPEIAFTLNNLATCLDAQRKPAEAEPLYRQALAIRRAVLGEEHPYTALTLSNLAVNLDHQGKQAEAERLKRQALAIRRKVLGEEHPEIASSSSNLASSLNDRGKYAEADLLYRKALAINRKALGGLHPETATSLYNLAVNLCDQGKDDEAEPLYREALAISRKVLGEQHPDTAQTLNSLALALTNQGKYEEAEPLFRAAAGSFEMARLLVSSTGFERASFGAKYSPFAGLAACLAQRGKPVEAWQAAESGLARGLLDDLSSRIAPPLDAEQRRRHQARANRLRELDQSLLPLLTATKLDDAQRKRRDTLRRERDTLQTELAGDAAELARREVSSLERIQKQIPADTAFVFWIDLRVRGQAADPASRHWGCVVRRTGPPAWLRLPGSGENDAWNESDTRLAERLHRSLAAGEPDWQGLARRLARQRLAPLEPALGERDDLPAVRHLITVPAGWMAGVPLEALGGRYTISYAPSGTVHARLREQHRSLSEPSLLALGDPAFSGPATPTPPSPPEHGLLLTFVQPGGNAARAGLREGDVLLRYGDRPLHTLADVKPAADGDPVPVQVWRDGKTLDVRLAPGKLGVLLHRQPAPAALVAQRQLDAALSVTRGEWKPLPGSRREVQAIARLFPRATVLLGSDASEQRLEELAAGKRLQDFRVLHLATHGQVDTTSAARSALLLARDRLPSAGEQSRLGNKVHDGRLTVAAIASGWQLDADLVTLSACETALGPQGGGDGLLGFSQILFQKGAHGLLLSLWKVDDTATALLMQRFYESWLGKRKDLEAPMARAEALREAKEWLRNLSAGERDRLAGRLRGEEVAAKPVAKPPTEAAGRPYSHPRYWAAFILIGDPD